MSDKKLFDKKSFDKNMCTKEKFTKRNTSGYPDALLKEVQGLELIKSAIDQRAITELAIPEIIHFDSDQLSLSLVKQCGASDEHMQQLGYGLAKLHKFQHDYYGLEYNNYIGLNPQPNEKAFDWGKFFVEQRLGFQISLIKNLELRQTFSDILQGKESRIKEYLNSNCNHPSIVHGDLWSGNVLFDEENVWLIDPAAYFGDREVDIAMTEMFGGFSQTFYRSYQAVYPLSKEYPLKREIYNLYHYLNHYNLFGASYQRECEERIELIRKL